MQISPGESLWTIPVYGGPRAGSLWSTPLDAFDERRDQMVAGELVGAYFYGHDQRGATAWVWRDQ